MGPSTLCARVRTSQGPTRWVRAALLVPSLASCAGHADHPPGIEDCANCGTLSTGGGRGLGGSSGGAGVGGGGAETGGAASATGGASGGTGLSGSVMAYSDPLFVNKTAFSGTGTVGVTGSKTVTGTIGNGKWSVSGADSSPALWADLQAPASSGAMETLEIIDGTHASADVVFAPRSTLEDIVGSLSSSQSLKSTGAHAVLSFFDASNQPLSGVKVTVSAAGATVAYDAGDTYTDAPSPPPLGATQQRGIAIVFNYPAGTAPASFSVQYVPSGSSAAASVDLRLVNDAVTFRSIVVK